MLSSLSRLRFTLLTLCLLLMACEVPDIPTGIPQPVTEISGEPICYQEIECVIEATRSNTQRKEAQETINTLILSDQPTYDRLCQAKSEEFTESVPQCKKAG